MKKTITLIVILLAIMASSMAQTQTTSTHLKFKNGISTDSIGSYTGDSLTIDGEGKLKLRDDIAGEYTLSELAAGSLSFGSQYQIPYTNAGGTNFDYSTNLTYESSIGSFYVGNDNTVPFTAIRSFGTDSDFDQYSDTENQILSVLYSNTATNSNKILRRRYGGVYGAFTAAPTNAVVSENQYHVYDGSGMTSAGTYSFQVDGAIATDDYDTKYTWDLKEGASASGLMLTLGVNGLEYNADHSTDQAANDFWIPDKAYVDGVATSDSAWTSITVDTISEKTGAHGIDFFAASARRMNVSSAAINVFEPILPLAAGLDLGRTSDFFRSLYIDKWYVEDVTTSIEKDGSNNLVFTDAITGPKTLAELAASGVSSDSSWTSIRVDTINPLVSNFVRFPGNISIANGEWFAFGDNDTYIKEGTDDYLGFISAGTNQLDIGPTGLIVRNAIYGVLNKTIDLGTSSRYWNDFFVDSIFIDDGSTNISKDVSNNLLFTDAVTGIKTLAELAASGSYTFDEGLTEVAGNVDLGGAFDATINIVSTNDANFHIRSGDGTSYGFIALGESASDDVDWGIWEGVGGDLINVSLNTSRMQITDEVNLKGFIYADDYSTNFTDRSLVDKEYVDTKADLITQENQTGTTYTFVLGDAGKLVTLSNAAAITLTIPTNASVAFPTNTVITFVQIGAGLVTVDDAAITMNSYGGADALLGQYAVATLIKTDTDTWLLSGAIE